MTQPSSSNDEQLAQLLDGILSIHEKIQREVRQACIEQGVKALSAVAEDGIGDTIYAVDKISEARLIDGFSDFAGRVGGVVLLFEGLTKGPCVLPQTMAEADAKWRILVDPIDGTRGIMYQKRSAWILTGVAPNRGDETRLRDIVLAVQTEIPIIKQELADVLWAISGKGAHSERVDLRTGERNPLPLTPSTALGIEHGYFMVTRFFPGARDVLAAIDEDLVQLLVGAPEEGKAICFEDQYASTGGQLYELMVGHDRFNADLRPLLASVQSERGQALPLCCHPYDLCTMLIALEAGVILRDPRGNPLDAPFDLAANVAWVGYANARLCERISPLLTSVLDKRGL